MGLLEYVIGGVLIAAAIFLIVMIMLQDKAKRGLSGAITGGSGNSYLGKNASSKKGSFLSKMTTIVSVVFVIVVVVCYLFSYLLYQA